jgi:hypothetical protein
MHGHKICLFCATGTGQALSSVSNRLSIFHPTTQQICIITSVETDVDVPQRVLEYAIMSPLNLVLKSFEQVGAPRLIELRIKEYWRFRLHIRLLNLASFLVEKNQKMEYPRHSFFLTSRVFLSMKFAIVCVHNPLFLLTYPHTHSKVSERTYPCLCA